MKKKKNKNNIGLYAALGCGALALYFLFKKDEASTSSAAAASAAEETAAEARTGADSGNATAAKIADYLLTSEAEGVGTEAGNNAQAEAIKLFETCKNQVEFLQLLKDVCIELGINDVVDMLTFFNLERTLDLQEIFIDFNVSFPEIQLSEIEEDYNKDEADKKAAQLVANYLKDITPTALNRQSALKVLQQYVHQGDRLLDVLTYVVEILGMANGWKDIIYRLVTDQDIYTFKQILKNNDIELLPELLINYRVETVKEQLQDIHEEQVEKIQSQTAKNNNLDVPMTNEKNMQNDDNTDARAKETLDKIEQRKQKEYENLTNSNSSNSSSSSNSVYITKYGPRELKTLML